MKDIYFISPSLPAVNCGVGDHVHNIVKSICSIKKNITLKVITSNNKDIDSSKSEIYSSSLIRIKKWSIVAFIRLLKSSIKNTSEKIYHYQYPIRYPVPRSIPFRVIPFSFILKIFSNKNDKIFITIHEYYKLSRIMKLYKLIELCFVDKIFVVTEVDKYLLSRFFTRKVEFFQVGSNIYHDTNAIHQKIVKEEKSIIFFGHIDESKGIKSFIDTIDILISKGEKINITILGRFVSKEYESIFKNHFYNLIEKNKIKFIDYMENKQLGCYLKEFDIGFLPFNEGAAPNRSSLIALLCAGLAVVTTFKTRITPSYLIDNHNCLLNQPYDSEGMARSLSSLINDEQLLSDIKSNTEKLINKFDWSIGANVISKHYDNIK